jgi:hypothetical protein
VAFKTLDQLRTSTPGLNDELGLTSDSDNSFGATGVRNGFLQRAFQQLWPDMARLTRESITTVANQQEYTLTTIVDAERIDVMDSTGQVLDRIRSWQLFADEIADPPTMRLTIPRSMTAGLTLKVLGYVPYIVPASAGSSCDLPPNLEFVVTAGARMYAYRAKMNQFANFERHQNENRQNAITAAEVLELFRTSQREFAQAVKDNRRELTGAHRAMLQTG